MNVRAVIPAALTISVGFITLFGLLIGDGMGLLSTLVTGLGIRTITVDFLLPIVTITLALTVLIGIVNLTAVHSRRVIARQPGFAYSILMLGSFVFVILAHLLNRQDVRTMLLEDVQLSIESALAGLLLFALVYGGATLTRRRPNLSSLVFVFVVLIVLIGAIPLSQTQAVRDLSEWLNRVPANAGARGILIGIALATLVTGIRVLIGQDRSYRE